MQPVYGRGHDATNIPQEDHILHEGYYFSLIIARSLLSSLFFKASALWADAFYKSKCPSVCLLVCGSVGLFTFEVPFNGLFAPTSRSQMSNIFLRFGILGEKYWKEVASHLNIFVWKWSKVASQKKVYFFADFALQNMVETRLPDGLETSGQRA